MYMLVYYLIVKHKQTHEEIAFFAINIILMKMILGKFRISNASPYNKEFVFVCIFVYRSLITS